MLFLSFSNKSNPAPDTLSSQQATTLIKHRRLLGLGVLLCASWFALLPSSVDAADSPKPLVMVLGAEPDGGFDPILGWGRYNNPLIQSALLRRSGGGEFIGDIASDWTLSPDRLKWTVTLRPNLVFSDGSPLNAEDVAFTFEQARKAAGMQDLSNLVKVEQESELQVEFTLKQADIGFIDTLAELAIVPSDSYGPDYGQHPIGSGPYKMRRWDKGQQLILEANPKYQSADPDNPLLKKPFFDKLVIVFADEDSRFAMLRTGQLQLSALAPRYADALMAQGNYRLWSQTSVDNRGIAWPMRAEDNPVTSELAVRQAFDMVIDRQQLVDNLLGGYARPAWSIADDLPWGGAVPDWADWQMKQRLLKASELLANAGWLPGADGIREKDGQRLTFPLYYLAGDSIREQLALASAQMARMAGFQVEPKADSWENIYRVMHQAPVLFGFGSLSANEMALVYDSRNAGKGYFNSGYYQNPLVDKALEKAREADSVETAIAFWQQAQQQISRDVPWSWLVNLQHLYAANPCLDLGQPLVEPHGHGWPITNNINQWRWQCP
ncbi:ABC transporter substrate-binding protein [Shewanella carassii]|nr:ABC transporter substrate-binding protein [Shewanella carassii]